VQGSRAEKMVLSVPCSVLNIKWSKARGAMRGGLDGAAGAVALLF